MDLEKFLSRYHSRYHSQGDVIDITLVKGGKAAGLGPVVVKVVVLDDKDTVAFRLESDFQDGEWQLGNIDELYWYAKEFGVPNDGACK